MGVCEKVKLTGIGLLKS